MDPKPHGKKEWPYDMKAVFDYTVVNKKFFYLLEEKDYEKMLDYELNGLREMGIITKHSKLKWLKKNRPVNDSKETRKWKISGPGIHARSKMVAQNLKNLLKKFPTQKISYVGGNMHFAEEYTTPKSKVIQDYFPKGIYELNKAPHRTRMV